MTAALTDIPPGFELMPVFGPFHELVGPLYASRRDAMHIVGLRVEEKHRNRGAMMHGGMICMLADTAIVWAAKHAREPRPKMLTTQLCVNLIGNAPPGAWVEAQVDVVRAGRRVVFANCYIWSQGQRIAQATAQCQVIGEEAS
jgi:uncharacterized protein (TIGR00369 family)